MLKTVIFTCFEMKKNSDLNMKQIRNKFPAFFYIINYYMKQREFVILTYRFKFLINPLYTIKFFYPGGVAPLY